MSSSGFQDQRCRGSCYKVVVFVATGLISRAQSIKKIFVPTTTTKFWPRCPQKVGNRDNAESAAKELKSSKDCVSCEPGRIIKHSKLIFEGAHLSHNLCLKGAKS